MEADISGSDRDVTLSRSGFLFLRLPGNGRDFYCLIGISLRLHEYMSAKAKDSGYIFISNPFLISASASFSFWPNFTLVLQQDFVAVDAVAAFPPPDVSV